MVVPHKGWTCTGGVEDLGEPCKTCEMCEVKVIRYVHRMTHPDYPGSLGCGCVCAGNMEQNKSGARQRETDFKNRQKREQRATARAEALRAAEAKRQEQWAAYKVKEQAAEEQWIKGVWAAAQPINHKGDEWHLPRKGNPYRTIDKYHTVVFPFNNGFLVRLTHTRTERSVCSGQVYPSIEGQGRVQRGAESVERGWQ